MSVRELFERVTSATAPVSRGAAALFHGVRIGLGVLLAILTYLLFPAAPAVDFPLYEVGAVASENVIAPFAFSVEKPDDQLTREREEVARAAEPVFVFQPAALDSSVGGLRRLADQIARVAATPPAGDVAIRLQQASSALGVQLSADEAAYLALPARRDAMVAAVLRVFNRWLADGVVSAGSLAGHRGTVTIRREDDVQRANSDSIVTFNDLLSRARRVHPDPGSVVGNSLFIKLLSAFFHPTLVLDRAATEQAREDLRRTVSRNQHEVRAGEKIVGAHEVVGRDENAKMRTLRDQIERRKGTERLAGRVTGAILFNFLVIAIFGITLVLFRPQLYRSLRALALFGAVYFVVVGTASIVAHGPMQRPELIPVAFAAVIFSVMFDPRISMIGAMILAVLVGGQSVFRGTNALFVNLVAGAAAAFSVRVLRRRNQTFYSILTTAAAYLLTSLALGLTLSWPLEEIGRSAGWGLANAVASVLLAMFFLPLAEKLTGVETDLTLLEWSDLNRPLMRRLSLEAPGTYFHTMAIANLAEAAATAIGANGLLARVGAYYHDIGKLKKPQYFVENQAKGRNPHDKLKPTTSASIIRGHIREGLELAEENQVPRAVRAFITEHHGTGRITYFFEKARERDGEVTSPIDFAYPGPIPQTAETAIVMLADGVEAATKVLNDPSPEKIRDVIDHIVRQRIEQGQLRDAPLTLRQIELVKEQFARLLIGMHHNRIDYPAAGGGVSAEFASSS